MCDIFLPSWWPHDAMRQILLDPIHIGEKIEAEREVKKLVQGQNCEVLLINTDKFFFSMWENGFYFSRDL